MFIKCAVEWCDRKKEGSDGYCKKHHHHIERYGEIRRRTVRDPNEVRERDEYYEIDMYNRQNRITGTMLISKQHYFLIKGKKVVLAKNGYPAVKDGNTIKCVHKIILPVKEGNYVDHINHIRTDNRIENLREVTPCQSSQNMKALGATYYKERCVWRTGITLNGKYIFLGSFKDKENAVLAYRKAAKENYGEYAYRYEEDGCL